jgi:hypothetical protein
MSRTEVDRFRAALAVCDLGADLTLAVGTRWLWN